MPNKGPTQTNRKRKIYETWVDIQENLGSANRWPRNIRTYLWTKYLKHWPRIMLAAFIFTNGMNPGLLMKWVDLMHLCRDQAVKRHFRTLFQAFEQGRYIKALYAFDLIRGRYEYLDGTPRMDVIKSQRT
ncbi:hypothetical protein BaRGS_00026378 [Batillaria attramentaria]|uniref:Uncharacterized protein n=1 Tax=Batillaria attramentaria TaxID=370345 RepID=A0ABD0K565_9CAEN